MDTKQQVTKKFILGVVLIVVSLVLGKLVLVPIVLFPESDSWRLAMIIVYVFSWVIILAGIYLAGIEGWRLATHKYREYRTRTVSKVKEKSKNAVIRMKDRSRHAARKTVAALREAKERKKPMM